jgi:hypothetical protein
MSNPHKRKKLARLKALMESKVVKEEVIETVKASVVTIPVIVDPVVEEVKTVEVLEVVKEEAVVVEEVKQVEEVQDTLSEVEVKKTKKKKE